MKDDQMVVHDVHKNLEYTMVSMSFGYGNSRLTSETVLAVDVSADPVLSLSCLRETKLISPGSSDT